MSIELVEGKVHLTFELGSGPLTLTSTKVYNTGVWYKIALNRNKRKGIAVLNYIFMLHINVIKNGLNRCSVIRRFIIQSQCILRKAL